MICWVVERALAARNVDRAIVATDDQRIEAAVRSAGYEAVMTSAEHRSGTDRIAEVAASIADADIIVNVQGDEPLISPLTVERAVEAMGGEGKGEKGEADGREWGKGKKGEWEKVEKGKGEGVKEEIGIVTTWEAIDSAADVLNPDVVKIVVDDHERAIYFSRSPVPYPRDAVSRHGSIEAAISAEPALLTSFRKHTGLYVYRREVLLEFAQWPQSALELLESLEQLRALEHGVNIKAIEASAPSIGVDTLTDLERVRRLVSSSKFQVSSSVGYVGT